MHIYLLRDMDENGGERADALLPGLRAVTGQLDYILRSDHPAQARIAHTIAAHQHMPHYCYPSAACAPGGSVQALVKDINRFIGKEHVLCVAAEDVWLGATVSLCGQGGAPADAPPLCLAHIHVRGMPAPGAGQLIEVLQEHVILARAAK